MHRLLIKIFLIFLPFHALLVTLSSKYLFGSTQNSLATENFFIASWKEIILFILLCLGLKHIRKFQWKNVDTWILLFILLHICYALVQYISHATPVAQVLWGLRSNLEMLGAFWIIRLFSWSKKDIHSFIKILLISTSISLFFGILQLVLPCESLQVLGYTSYKSSWVADKPLPCGHGVGEGLQTIRMMGTFSSPNALASFLILTLGLLWYSFKEKIFSKWLSISLFTLNFLALIVTFARGALLGTLISLGILFFGMNKNGSQSTATENKNKKIFTNIGLGIFIFALIIGGFIFFSPSRINSTLEHFQKPIAGIHRVIENPWGHGVGEAGPITLRFPPDGSQAKVSENWYIQIAEEIGVFGLGIALAFLITTFSTLWREKNTFLPKALLFMFIALSINNLFLHTWTNDTATSLVFWIMLGIFFPLLHSPSKKE